MSAQPRGDFGEVTVTLEYTADDYAMLREMLHRQHTTPRVLDALGQAIDVTTAHIADCERSRHARA